MPVYKEVNKDFFSVWTSEMAYVLGFFFADGSYDVNPRGSEYFSFQIVDKALLYEIRKAMGSDHKIAVRPPRDKNDSIQYRLQIGSKKMCSDLQLLGVQQNKVQTARFPKVPKTYLGDFVRGYFDGDGNVWSGYINKHRTLQRLTLLTAFTSCSQNFLMDLQKICKEYGAGNGSLFQIKKSNAYRLQYSAKDSIILFNLMYGKPMGSRLFLKRKKKIFEKFTNKKNCGTVREILRPLHSKRIQK